MGMFDIVYFKCPSCDGEIEAQSKAGECCLLNFNQNDVPPGIAGDINGSTIWCQSCNKAWQITSEIPMGNISMTLIKPPEG